MVDLSGYKLTFSDEFNERSISQTGEATTWADIRDWWRFDANSDIGFGASSFVDPASGYDPFHVSDGVLSITAVPDRTPFGCPSSWESGLIHTKASFTQTYGYFEIRADFADQRGAWDAFWLLPLETKDPNHTGAWQELDIVEHYGDIGNEATYRWIHTTDYTADANSDLQVTSHNPSQVTGFHTYGMDWQADKISFYFDGEFMGSKMTPSDMHEPMFILANLATESNANDFGVPMTTKIDYIRAYSKDPNAVDVGLDEHVGPSGVLPAVDPGPTPPPVVTPVAAEAHPIQDATPAAHSREAPAVATAARHDGSADNVDTFLSLLNTSFAPQSSTGVDAQSRGAGAGVLPVVDAPPQQPPAFTPVAGAAHPVPDATPMSHLREAPTVREASHGWDADNFDTFLSLLNTTFDPVSLVGVDTPNGGANSGPEVSDIFNGRDFAKSWSGTAWSRPAADELAPPFLIDGSSAHADIYGAWPTLYAGRERDASLASQTHLGGESMDQLAMNDHYGQRAILPVEVDHWFV